MHRPGLLPGACDMGNPCSRHLAGCSWPATECRGCLCKMGWGADSSDGDSSLKAFHQPGGNVLEPVGSAKVAYPAPPSPFPHIIPSSCHLLQLSPPPKFSLIGISLDKLLACLILSLHLLLEGPELTQKPVEEKQETCIIIPIIAIFPD